MQVQTEDLHEHAGPDVWLGVEPELLLGVEARDVLVETASGATVARMAARIVSATRQGC